ncbi:hypothetical protein BGZ73_006382 [Actinomortierella ambigua]|nr:hypothetical protein BGZ73_006382 [Actinomortierella ambigua]
MLFSSLSKASVALIAASILLLLTSHAEAHSWLDCVDWRFKNSKNKSWADSNGVCHGFARRFAVKARPFAKYDSDWPSRHYEQSHSNPDNSPACSPGKNGVVNEKMAKPWTAAYNGKDQRGRRMGGYTTKRIGDTLCLRWPAKNHAVPGEHQLSEVFVYMSQANPKRDPTQKEFFKRRVATLNYKNCTKGGSTDSWPCGGCFKLPKDMRPGHHVLQWRWRLNPKEWYTSCADINVRAK